MSTERDVIIQQMKVEVAKIEFESLKKKIEFDTKCHEDEITLKFKELELKAKSEEQNYALEIEKIRMQREIINWQQSHPAQAHILQQHGFGIFSGGIVAGSAPHPKQAHPHGP